MDFIIYLMQPVAIFAFLGVAYLIIISGRSSRKKNDHYAKPDDHEDWNFAVKKLWARYAISRWKKHRKGKDVPIAAESEVPRRLTDEESWDSKTFSLFNLDGSSLHVSLKKRAGRMSEVVVLLNLADGTSYQLPNNPDTVFTNTNSETWSGGGLKLTALEPFRRWRISFNGLLSRGILNEVSDTRPVIHVKFNFIWNNCQKPVFNIQDWSNELMADAISKEPWRHPHWIEQLDQWSEGGYHQLGSAMGEVYLGSDSEPRALHLRGVRVRHWAPLGSAPVRRTLALQGIAQDGTAYLLQSNSYYEGLAQISHGTMRIPSGDQNAIDSCDLQFKDFGEFKSHIPKAYTVIMTSGKREFRITLELESQKKMIVRSGSPWEWENILIPYHCGVNEDFGRGLLLLGYSYFDAPHSEKNTFPHVKELKWGTPTQKYSSNYCVDFSEHGAICPQLVGAKGASLALLHSTPSRKYVVPPGFCLTVNAMSAQINSASEIQESIKKLENVPEKLVENDMKKACERVVKAFNSTPIISEVESSVNNYMEKLRMKIENEVDYNKVSFAVRSSGIGEDSEELSAAGQNLSILGCITNDDVIRAVQECWASLFSFQSIEYRRHHGQVANCGMGVVIQVVVQAQAAGVMFTRHPNTGDPSYILITSNYGLGESVVSGDVEPDTILLSRTYTNAIKIDGIEIGKKTHKVLVKVDGGGTESVRLSDGETTLASLSEEQCLSLGEIATEQEALWGAPRDIEWAIYNNKIYLLQARPITSLDRWTEYELTHEFDSPVMSEEDMMSFANTGEVLPGAVSPLTLSTVVDGLDKGIGLNIHQNWKNEWYQEALSVTHHHPGINVMNTLYRRSETEVSVGVKVLEMGIFGHQVMDERIHAITLRRRPAESILMNVYTTLQMFVSIWEGKRNLEKLTYISKQFKLDLGKYNRINELFKAIDDSLVLINECSLCHSKVTTISLFSEFFAMSVLLEGKKEFTSDHYQDIGKILSSCKDVISAEVPTALSEISTAIRSSGKSAEFSKVPIEESEEWLESNCSEAATKLNAFFEHHGHRSIKEFDLATETWGMNHRVLLKTLQAGVSSVGRAGPAEGTSYASSPEELVSQLVSPKSSISKRLLRIFVPICQTAVARREATKEALISLIHKFRMAYLALARKMLEEWYIPDEKLIFYFTQYELKDYIRTRNPAYVSKALQRRRLFPKWDSLQFLEINEGCPQPINTMSHKIELRKGSTEDRLIGTPVCPGDIIGRACVVQRLSEIGQLENGDILITTSTDIGWSPYFPLLGGVVTELGGLISHGAVVAREYGLPCIVGARGATTFFKTGDMVLLSGAKGFLEKINSAKNVSA